MSELVVFVAVDIKQLELMYFQNNKDVPYHLVCDKDILIKPISVEDWSIFEYCLDVIRINKNEVNNGDFITMSYLDFIIQMIMGSEEKDDIINKLVLLLKYSIGEEKMSIEEYKGKKVLAICDDQNFIKYYITSKEFDDIKNIILHQNIYDYDDRYIAPDIRKAINAYNKIKTKNQVSPTLEMQKVFVIGKTGMSMDELNKMKYRTFSQLYKMKIKEDLYFAKTMYKTSQKYDVKDDVTHPVFEKETDILDEIFVDADSFTQKIQNGSNS